jgi:hypothetical protein
MSAGLQDGGNRAVLEEVFAGSGVKVTLEDVDAVAGSLARIRRAAATLLPSPSFDETAERFYRLLEIETADGAGK